MGNYDDWIFHNPADDKCELCDGHKKHDCMNCGGDGEIADGVDCPVCEGSGEVDCACADEPDGDYLYEKARDERMEQ